MVDAAVEGARHLLLRTKEVPMTMHATCRVRVEVVQRPQQGNSSSSELATSQGSKFEVSSVLVRIRVT